MFNSLSHSLVDIFHRRGGAASQTKNIYNTIENIIFGGKTTNCHALEAGNNSLQVMTYKALIWFMRCYM